MNHSNVTRPKVVFLFCIHFQLCPFHELEWETFAKCTASAETLYYMYLLTRTWTTVSEFETYIYFNSNLWALYWNRTRLNRKKIYETLLRIINWFKSTYFNWVCFFLIKPLLKANLEGSRRCEHIHCLGYSCLWWLIYCK